MQKKKLRWVVGLVFSSLLFYLALRGTELTHIWHLLKRTDPSKAAAAVIFLFLSFWARAWRWHFLLLPVKSVPIMPLFRSTMIGFMGNYLLPFHAGEVMRAVSIGQTQNISKSSALGSVVLERILDGITLSVIPFLLVAVLDLPPWVIQIDAFLFGIYLAGLAVIMLSALRGWTEIRLKRFFSLFPQRVAFRLGWTADLFFDGAKGLSTARALLPVSLLSLLCWFLHGVYYWLLFEALNLNLSLGIALILQVMIGIGIMLPAGPGYVGNFEYATVLGLTLFGIDTEAAFAYSLLAHSCQLLPVIIVGLLFAVRGGLSLRMEAQKSQVATALSNLSNTTS